MLDLAEYAGNRQNTENRLGSTNHCESEDCDYRSWTYTWYALHDFSSSPIQKHQRGTHGNKTRADYQRKRGGYQEAISTYQNDTLFLLLASNLLSESILHAFVPAVSLKSPEISRYDELMAKALVAHETMYQSAS